MFRQTLGEEVVGKLTCLFQAIDAFGDFKIDPTIVCILGEVIFIDEFLGNVRQFYADVLWSVEWCSEVEVGDVKAG